MKPSEKKEETGRLKRVISAEDCRRFLESQATIPERAEQNNSLTGATREITEIIRNKIVWGVYGRNGLIKIEEFREIEVLTPDDWEQFQKLYLKGLYTFPWAFGAKYEDQEKKSEEDVRRLLAESTVFGLKHKGHNDEGTKEKLVGIAQLRREEGVRDHVCTLGKVFVHPAHWHHGIGEQLTYTALDHAISEGIQLVDIVVTSTNSFKKFYEKIGFKYTFTKNNEARVKDPVTNTYQWYDWDYYTLDLKDYEAFRSDHRLEEKSQ